MSTVVRMLVMVVVADSEARRELISALTQAGCLVFGPFPTLEDCIEGCRQKVGPLPNILVTDSLNELRLSKLQQFLRDRQQPQLPVLYFSGSGVAGLAIDKLPDAIQQRICLPVLPEQLLASLEDAKRGAVQAEDFRKKEERHQTVLQNLRDTCRAKLVLIKWFPELNDETAYKALKRRENQKKCSLEEVVGMVLKAESILEEFRPHKK